jgi:uncharacterized membrane protein
MDQMTKADPASEKPDAGMTSVLKRNIRVMDLRREFEESHKESEQRVADAVTAFAGSMWSVYVHLVLFGFWIIANLGWVPGVPAWDPSFVVLAMWASVEAIFLTTFVLISQNRMAVDSQKQADLDLQINLLAEHEVTKLVALTSAIAEHLGLQTADDPDIQESKKDVQPEDVLDEIEESEDLHASEKAK